MSLVEVVPLEMIDCFLDLLVLSYPTVTTILLKALDVWYFDPFVTTPVLKLITELVLNRSQVDTHILTHYFYCVGFVCTYRVHSQ